MSEDSVLRERMKNNKASNGTKKTKSDGVTSSGPYEEFAQRESPLTVLLRASPHIRAIYHIFIAILMLLLLDTLIYDLIERGKINVGISVVINGFGDVGRCLKLWILEFLLALIFYFGLTLYVSGASVLQSKPLLFRAWSFLGFLCAAALQTVLVAVPVWDLARVHLALASSCVVTLEMIRFWMKIYAVAVACSGRYKRDSPALPSFGHYIYFLFAPTLLYRDRYPRTKQIRWTVVTYHFMEVAAIIFYNSFLWERFILPYWSDYGKESQVEAGRVIRGIFACVLPGVISFLCGFYCLLHAWLNAFAEMLTFADRLFYEEWWTMSQFSKYYRAWNRVVHSWLRDHIYLPLGIYLGRNMATFIVFFISSVAHELVLALSFGFFYPVLLIEFGVFGLLCVPLTATYGRRFPNVFNLLMWFCFLIGNGLLWSLYPMEYFARQNCPSSETDSFFTPKSWTCPEIIIKPNWTFQNPLIY